MSDTSTLSEATFEDLVRPQRPRLLAHAYRMLASPHDAEDAVQEALQRAWQRRATFDGTGPFAAWLYRITTNVCLDQLRKAKRRGYSAFDMPPATDGSGLSPPNPELAWVEPIADVALREPGEAVLELENVRLAFVAVLQNLPARQRAALLLHDVVGFTAVETADLLDTSQGALNGLLHRARTTLAADRPALQLADPADPEVRNLLTRYVSAWETSNVEVLTEIVADDIFMAMPPLTEWYQGVDASMRFVDQAIFAPAGAGSMRLRRFDMNSVPGFVVYELQRDGSWAPGGVQLIEIAGEQPRVHSITSFRTPDVIERAAALIDR